MDHFRQIAMLAIYLSCAGMANAAESDKSVIYNQQSAEREMLNRSFKIHLRAFENDWEEIHTKNKGYFYGMYDDKAQNAFMAKSIQITDIFYEIFFDPKNPNAEQAKSVADLQAKLMLRYYYNQQCQNIIFAYPKKYSAYSYSTPELQMIYTLETLALKLKEALVKQVTLIKKESSVEIQEDLINAIESPPLSHNYHEIFNQQLAELQRVGTKAYLQTKEEAFIEQSKQLEKKRLEEERLELERKKNIPLPPSLLKAPTHKPAAIIGKPALFSNLADALISKNQLNPVNQGKRLSHSVPKTKGGKEGSIPAFIDEINKLKGNARARLKPAGDRILAKKVADDKENELFNFFKKKIEDRRFALDASIEEEPTDWDGSTESLPKISILQGPSQEEKIKTSHSEDNVEIVHGEPIKDLTNEANSSTE